MRKVFATIAVLAMLVVPAKAEVYPDAGIVSCIDDDGLVTVTEFGGSGNLWQFYCESNDYMVGDVVALLMDDDDTEEVWDDTIVDHRYVGFIF